MERSILKTYLKGGVLWKTRMSPLTMLAEGRNMDKKSDGVYFQGKENMLKAV